MTKSQSFDILDSDDLEMMLKRFSLKFRHLKSHI